MHTKFLSENLKGRDHVEDLGIHGNIILEWVLGKEGEGCELVASGLGEGTLMGSCEHGNESLGSVKGGEVLD
jgi:hypothetical protein